MNRLLSLDVWVGVFVILGVAGIVLAVVGTITEQSWARTTGFVLLAPIILLGSLLVVIGFPILMVANYRHARQAKDDYDGRHDDAQA